MLIIWWYKNCYLADIFSWTFLYRGGFLSSADINRKVIRAVTHLTCTCIWAISGSIIEQNTDYHDWGFSGFTSASLKKVLVVDELFLLRAFQAIIIAKIRRYRNSVTDSVMTDNSLIGPCFSFSFPIGCYFPFLSFRLRILLLLFHFIIFSLPSFLFFRVSLSYPPFSFPYFISFVSISLYFFRPPTS